MIMSYQAVLKDSREQFEKAYLEFQLRAYKGSVVPTCYSFNTIGLSER